MWERIREGKKGKNENKKIKIKNSEGWRSQQNHVPKRCGGVRQEWKLKTEN